MVFGPEAATDNSPEVPTKKWKATSAYLLIAPTTVRRTSLPALTRPRYPCPEAVEEAICFGWTSPATTALEDHLPTADRRAITSFS